MFKNLFRKNNDSTSNNNDQLDLRELVNRSTLPLLTHKLFMHYFDPNAAVDEQNPEWQNQGIFFWTSKEAFERKSLPPHFKNLEKKYFIVNQLPPNYQVALGKAIPWFGMPGNGDKYYIHEAEKQLTLDKLAAQQVISYVKRIELIQENANVLHDRLNYRLLLDDQTMRYDPSSDKFYYNNTEVSLGGAFELGAVEILKIIPSNSN